MRELKFRAWDDKAMYRPDFIVNNDGGFPMNQTGGEEINDAFYCPDHPLMQYTGLKDKNGVEIYEGDIVRITHPFKDREWVGEIEYDRYAFGGKGFYFTHFDTPGDLFSEGTDYIEVVGNIYENPDLLKP